MDVPKYIGDKLLIDADRKIDRTLECGPEFEILEQGPARS